MTGIFMVGDKPNLRNPVKAFRERMYVRNGSERAGRRSPVVGCRERLVRVETGHCAGIGRRILTLSPCRDGHAPSAPSLPIKLEYPTMSTVKIAASLRISITGFPLRDPPLYKSNAAKGRLWSRRAGRGPLVVGRRDRGAKQKITGIAATETA
jgi:hypothetical protein